MSFSFSFLQYGIIYLPTNHCHPFLPPEYFNLAYSFNIFFPSLVSLEFRVFLQSSYPPLSPWQHLPLICIYKSFFFFLLWLSEPPPPPFSPLYSFTVLHLLLSKFITPQTSIFLVTFFFYHRFPRLSPSSFLITSPWQSSSLTTPRNVFRLFIQGERRTEQELFQQVSVNCGQEIWSVRDRKREKERTERPRLRYWPPQPFCSRYFFLYQTEPFVVAKYACVYQEKLPRRTGRRCQTISTDSPEVPPLIYSGTSGSRRSTAAICILRSKPQDTLPLIYSETSG